MIKIMGFFMTSHAKEIKIYEDFRTKREKIDISYKIYVYHFLTYYCVFTSMKSCIKPKKSTSAITWFEACKNGNLELVNQLKG
jgi:hypothetical protein